MSAETLRIVAMGYYVDVILLVPSEMLNGSLQTTFSVAVARRTSPSIIASMRPFLVEFVGDEGIGT